MGVTTGILTKAYTATANVAKRRIVKLGAADGTVVLAAAATDLLYGVSDHELDRVSGERVDVHLSGIVEVDAGGTIARGDLVTSDASGKAVTTVTAANRYIGIAEVSGVSGDVITVRLAPGLI